MKFTDIKGNEVAAGVLRGMVESRRVPHAMLFHENPGCGGLALAQAFVTYLNCANPHDGEPCGECPSCRQMAKMIHPDVHYVFPVNTGDVIKGEHPVSDMGIARFRELALENPFFTEQDLYTALGIESKAGNISVYEAKEIINKLSLSSVTGSFRTVIMFLPERMNIAAANKLLKLIEEPPAETLFILITQNPEDVITTIYSRCQLIRVLPSDRAAVSAVNVTADVEEIWVKLMEALLSRDLMAALECADALDALKSREKQKAFCAFAANHLRSTLLFARGMADIAYVDKSSSGTDLEALSRRAAAALSSKFYMRSVACLDKAAMLVGRNVSAKMVFTDLVNHLYCFL